MMLLIVLLYIMFDHGHSYGHQQSTTATIDNSYVPLLWILFGTLFAALPATYCFLFS